MSSYGRLEHAIETICTNRGIPMAQGKAAFADVLAAMHENTVKARDPEGSVLQQTYFVLGPEAAYHLGGVLESYEPGIATEELRRMDSDLTRFKTTVDRWKMELQKDQEAGE